MHKQTKFIIFFSVLIFLVSLGIGIVIGYFAIGRGDSQKTKGNTANYEALYDSFEKATKFLEKHEVDYMMSSGTLIGTKRQFPPGPMVWDDDLDFMISESEIPKMERMFEDPEFKEQVNHRVFEFNGGWFYKLQSKAFNPEGVANHLDIFIIRHGENPTRKEFIYYLDSFPREGFEKKEDFETEACIFWGREVKCPKGWEVYLSKVYGQDWNKTAHKYNHNGGGIEAGKEKVDLTLPENKMDLVSAIPPQLITRLTYKNT